MSQRRSFTVSGDVILGFALVLIGGYGLRKWKEMILATDRHG
jgi:hypothetical protein